jgi:choline dehydrogenase-like flavoprotein
MSHYDVAVIGGGPAGLSAALVLSRPRRGVVVVDAGRPRNAPAAHMYGYLSRDGLAPAELVARSAGSQQIRGRWSAQSPSVRDSMSTGLKGVSTVPKSESIPRARTPFKTEQEATFCQLAAPPSSRPPSVAHTPPLATFKKLHRL